MNSAWQQIVKQIPFYPNHGTAAQTFLVNYLPHRKGLEDLAACFFGKRLQRVVARTKKLAIATQQQQKQYYDATDQNLVFAVSEEVVRSTAGLDVKVVCTKKLAPKCFRPFVLSECIDPVAYKLLA